MNRISPTIDEVELRRVCGIMEELSNRYELSDVEQQALETAAIALMAANLTNALKTNYKKLADAHNGNIPEELRNNMLAHGIDIDSLEAERER